MMKADIKSKTAKYYDDDADARTLVVGGDSTFDSFDLIFFDENGENEGKKGTRLSWK